MNTLYVLKLIDGMWYVGTTVCTGHYRVQQHRDGHGSLWTRKHPMIRVAHMYHLDPGSSASRQENMVWMWLARRYGPHRVRGGDVTINKNVVPDYLLPEEFGGTRIVDW